jgi:hypothetical protein
MKRDKNTAMRWKRRARCLEPVSAAEIRKLKDDGFFVRTVLLQLLRWATKIAVIRSRKGWEVA